MSTKIEWAQEVWNPITGCSKISPGCQNCYAERMAKRLKGRYGYPKDDPFKVTFHPDKLDQPTHWKKPRIIFVCSMGDLFHDDVKEMDLFRITKAIHWDASQHTYLILTKRPERMKNWFENYYDSFGDRASREFYKNNPTNRTRNMWLGVTAENQEQADKRIPILLQIPVAVRFVSVEPMLEPVDISSYLPDDPDAYCAARECAGCGDGDEPCKEAADWYYDNENNKLDWVIAGSESGRGRRHAPMEWFRDLKNQCLSADVPFFFKQWCTIEYVYKMPELDGKTWRQYPSIKRRINL